MGSLVRAVTEATCVLQLQTGPKMLSLRSCLMCCFVLALVLQPVPAPFPPGDPRAFLKTWFETSGDCSAATDVINGPTLFRGSDLDPKKICFQLEDGSYELREGFLGNCGGPCCIFYGEAAR